MILILCSLQKLEEHPIYLSVIWLILQPYGELEARFLFCDPDLNPVVHWILIRGQVSHLCYCLSGLHSWSSNSPSLSASPAGCRQPGTALQGVLARKAVCQQNSVTMAKEKHQGSIWIWARWNYILSLNPLEVLYCDTTKQSLHQEKVTRRSLMRWCTDYILKKLKTVVPQAFQPFYRAW